MTAGEAVTVAGQAGRLVNVPVDPGCRAIGGDEEWQIYVPSQAIWNWQQLDACIRGPSLAPGEAIVRALISGLSPGPTEEPMPSDATIPNDNGYVVAPGTLRLRDVTLTYPSTWQSTREPLWSLDRMAIATIGPPPVPTCANWASCGVWPAMTLAPGGIIVSVWNRGPADWTFAGAAGQPMKIGGRDAKLTTAAADTACAAIGGDQSMTAVLPDDPAGQNFVEFDACLRGPDTGPNEAVFRTFLASGVKSPHWTPDESPSPAAAAASPSP
jgi:hypothetical protein